MSDVLTVEHLLKVSAEKTVRIAALEEALTEAIDEWASFLNCMPNVRGRKRLDEVRALLGQEDK
jgi:muramidase (phage lysozyme)